MLADLPLILSCWFLTLLWQLVGFPFLYRLYAGKLVDAAWAVGRLLTWLIIAIAIWFAAHLGLPVNQPVMVYIIFFGLFAHAVYFYKQNHQKLTQFFKQRWSLLLTQEILFLVFFLFLSFVRGFNPRIEGLEKFMDVGLMATYLRSPTLPAQDIWLAGETINYYTFGHFMGAIVTQFWGLSVDYAYNLILGLIMGLVASQGFSLVINLVQNIQAKIQFSYKHLIKAGLIGSLLLVLAGNGHTAWYWLKNKSFEGYWYPDATRFIDRTIHEFPAYSFIVSDLHAHVWDLPLVLLLLVNILVWLQHLLTTKTKIKKLTDWFRQPVIAWAGLVGFQLGLMMSTSAWDFMIYGLLLGVIGLIVLFKDRTKLEALIYSAVAVVLAASVGLAPWLLSFESISEGVRLATEHSPLWQLLVLWLPHVVMSSLALFVALQQFIKVKSIKKLPPQLVLLIAMIVMAWILLILPELVYMKDIYPNHPRANTMFKLTFQAFILMSLAAAWLSISWQQFKAKRFIHLSGKLVMFLFLLAVMIYPYFGYKSFYANLKHYQGLDGLSWLRKQTPGDYAAILWLRNNVVGQPVILEAVGESYTTYGRISTFTGLPTVLGWRVHEWLWRGGFDIPGQRTTEVKLIYEQPQSAQAHQLLNQYKVQYIIIGSKEREAYPSIKLLELLELGQLVFHQDQTYIIKLD
jgi:uncharacterized membrane protein